MTRTSDHRTLEQAGPTSKAHSGPQFQIPKINKRSLLKQSKVALTYE
jgi:hypothetical protein